MGRRHTRAASLLLAALVLTGCWDRREIEERNTVLAVGADLCEPEQGCQMEITRQIVDPTQVPLGGRPRRSTEVETVLVLRNQGKDDIDASGKATAELHRDMHFGHIRIFMVNEALARQGIRGYMHWIHGLPEQGYLEWFAVAEGRAGDIISARPTLEPLPGLYLYHLLDDAYRTGRLQRVFLSDLQITLNNQGEDAVAPLLRLAGPDRPALAGLAVFRGATMVGKLSPEETITYLQLRGIKRGAELIRVDLGDERWAYLRVQRRTAQYRLRWSEGRVHVALRIQLETDLYQLSHGLTVHSQRLMKRLEEDAGRLVAQQADALIARLQKEMGADVLAIGQRVRGFLPSVWATTGDWHQTYAMAQIDVSARVAIRRVGLSTK